MWRGVGVTTGAGDREWQKWFEGIWEDREERVYRAFFGGIGAGIYNLSEKLFLEQGAEAVDPRFLFHGVFECPPTERRREWVYVTSGMSNAWGADPKTVNVAEYSGLGFELTLHTKEQAVWGIRLLQYVMVVQLMMATGQRQGELVRANDRINLGAPLWLAEGELTHLLVTEPVEGTTADYPRQFVLGSGVVDLLLLVGITGKEAEFARTQETGALVNALRARGVFPVTDPGRKSVI
jgi:hypothetical protein